MPESTDGRGGDSVSSSESRTKIDQLIITSPYEEPTEHWEYVRHRGRFERKPGRRSAGYLIASPDAQAFDDPGMRVEIPLVNQVRKRVAYWRNQGYPGVTGVTRRLLQYWMDPEEFDTRRFFFCQLEAAETFIWLKEAPPTEHVGIDIPGDGGAFARVCAKMATGSGKTVVMAMLIAWQILNKVYAPQDPRFSKSVLVVAPGLTVRRRLTVLDPRATDNYYRVFRIVPAALEEKLRQGRVKISNWHALAWETDQQLSKSRSVDKRGPKSDEAYIRDVLGPMAAAKNLLVINDEAHHAWRVSSDKKTPELNKADKDTATKWIGALDRIHRVRGILDCYDFSATPFVPGGRRSSEEALFGWIVSDFGLNDAIESGLVKTPRVVIRDDALPDAKTYRSRLYHIYNDKEVKDNLNRRVPPHTPLPDLVTNAYLLLGYDWEQTEELWRERGAKTPPVMITVTNRTETAARVKFAFDQSRIRIKKLCNPDKTLHIDSKVLGRAEAADEELDISEKISNKNEREEFLRQQVNTVGQIGQPGEQLQKVISVGMLSEGWDAKTVTHIMGLRAFSSQLLCEQVVGRGLRRTSYDINPETGLLDAEYVNIFGIPFTFLPHEKSDGNGVVPPIPMTRIAPDADKLQFEVSWPNIVRINHKLGTRLHLDMDGIEPLFIDAAKTVLSAETAPFIEGRPDITRLNAIELNKLGAHLRTQRTVFETARDIYASMKDNWTGGQTNLIAQLIRIIERLMASNTIQITPPSYAIHRLKRRVTLTLNMRRIADYVQHAVETKSAESRELILDQEHPIGSTSDMRPWFTRKPYGLAQRSHINYCVYDSTLEKAESANLDKAPEVDAWVKNDHLGFEVAYQHEGIFRKYRPDFIIRLTSGEHLIIETKGKEKPEDKSKLDYMREWVLAVNEHGGFGKWHFGVSWRAGDILGYIQRLSTG